MSTDNPESDPADTVREHAASRMSGGQGQGPIRSYDEEQVDHEVRKVRARFTYQPLRDGDAERYVDIGNGFRDLAELIVRTCPAGRERATALTELSTARMHANAAIALHGTEGA